MHRNTPRAHRTPTLTTASPQEKKRKQSARDEFIKKIIQSNHREKEANNNSTSTFRIKPESHKENPVVVDDDVNDKQKQDESKDDNVDKQMMLLRRKTMMIKLIIHWVPELISKEFATYGPKMIEELFQKHMQNTTLNLSPTLSTPSSSTAIMSTADLQYQLYLSMKSKPQDQAADPDL
nr:hypothetical protein [Tanacetum cinerariifolium]